MKVYWKRCSLCQWNGRDNEIKAYKRVGGGKMFPVCPNCGQHKRAYFLSDGTRCGNASVLIGYAKEEQE